MKTMQRGFTLIELVVVIIILGIMAAIAVPKFVDITVDAHNSAARGVAGAISSGSAINFATRTANAANGAAMTGTNVCTAATLQTMLTGTTPVLQAGAAATDDQFQVSGTGNCTTAGTGATVTCSITPKGTGVTAAPATLICIP